MKCIFRSIALSLVLVLLASCSYSQSLMSFMPETDNNGFGGYEFVIKGNWPKTWDPNADNGSDSDGSEALSLMSDSVLAHNEKLMEEYDFKLKAVLADWTWAQDMAIDIIADTVDYDLMDTNINFMINNIKSGYANPWDYSGIDISDTSRYGAKGFLEVASFDGLHYGIWPMNWTSVQSYRGVLGVNNNVLNKFMDINVHELYENGKWTFHEFKNILTTCLADERVHPMSCYDENMLIMCSILANGGNLVGFDEVNGNYYYGMRDDKTIRGIEFAQSLVNEGLVIQEYDYGAYFKKEQTAAFYITESWTLGGDIEDMDMICYPFGPDGEYGKDFGAYRTVNERCIFMPVTADPAYIGRFINIWFDELDGYPKSTMIEDFKMNNFYNDESFDMWVNLSENAKYDYAFELYDVYDRFMETLRGVVYNGKSLTEFIQGHEGYVQAEIDKNLNN